MTFKTEFFEKEYDIPDGYLAVKTRACSARINVNLDCFEKTELEKAWLTYEGCTNVFVEHTYTKTDDDPAKYDDGIDRSRSRGYVAAVHYDADESVVYLLLAIDKAYEELCDLIIDGSLGAVSMGCNCTLYCSNCGGEFDDCHPCECRACPNLIGTQIDGHLVYDIMRDVNFYEISIVAEPADQTALFYEVIDGDSDSDKAEVQNLDGTVFDDSVDSIVESSKRMSAYEGSEEDFDKDIQYAIADKWRLLSSTKEIASYMDDFNLKEDELPDMMLVKSNKYAVVNIDINDNEASDAFLYSKHSSKARQVDISACYDLYSVLKTVQDALDNDSIF